MWNTAKSYGRRTNQPQVFVRQPSADPYLFESDDESASEKLGSVSQPAKKKTKGNSVGEQRVKTSRSWERNAATEATKSSVAKETKDAFAKISRTAVSTNPSVIKPKVVLRDSGLEQPGLCAKRKPLVFHSPKSTTEELVLPSSKIQPRATSRRLDGSTKGANSNQISRTAATVCKSSDGDDCSVSLSKRTDSRSHNLTPNYQSVVCSTDSRVSSTFHSGAFETNLEDSCKHHCAISSDGQFSNTTASVIDLPLKDYQGDNKQLDEMAISSTGLSQEMASIDIDSQENVHSRGPPAGEKISTEVKAHKLSDPFDLSSDSDDDTASCKQLKLIRCKRQDLPTAEPPSINFKAFEKASESKPKRTMIRTRGSPKKSPGKYSYNPRSWLSEEQDERVDGTVPVHLPNRDEMAAERTTKPICMTKVTLWPDKVGMSATVKVKVKREQKKLFTVVRNVREAHECQDQGETQQFDDDLDFLLEGLSPEHGISSRCLSALSLATKCTNPTFRMHLRALSSLSSIFDRLSDAYVDPRLALSTTAVMYMLCQDRLNMDMERGGLELLVKLLQMEEGNHLSMHQDKLEYEKALDTVHGLYRSSLAKGSENCVDRHDLSAGYLAMECLLLLTSRRSGEWFKEELRTVGALENIMASIIDQTCVVMKSDWDQVIDDEILGVVKKICRELRVLEHVTVTNDSNQRHITQQKGGEFVMCLCRLLTFCESAIANHYVDESSPSDAPGYSVIALLIGLLRVLVNVTHNSVHGCDVVSTFDGCVEILLRVILQAPQYVLPDQRFDILVLGIGLAINMCEHSATCRQVLLHAETLSSYDSVCGEESLTATEALVHLFQQRLEAAERLECETELAENGSETNPVLGVSGDDINESITDVLHKAGRHMEDTIVASYVALLIGVLVQHSPDYTDQIKEFLPDQQFDQIIEVLQRFLDFMKMTDAVSGNSGSKSIGSVITFLKEMA